MWLFLWSHVPAMPQNLGAIALPFAVLRIASFLRMDLPRGYQGLKFLGTTYYLRGRVLTECLTLHHAHDVLQHDRFRIDRRNQTLSHRLRCSCDQYAAVVKIQLYLPFATLKSVGQQCRCRSGANGIEIISVKWEAKHLLDLHASELLGNAFLGYSYCLFHVH